MHIVREGSSFHWPWTGPCCPGNFDPAFKKGVGGVRTYVARCACDENVAKWGGGGH